MTIVFKSKNYIIYDIPDDEENAHQFGIRINESCLPKLPASQIDRDIYSMPEDGIEGAKRMAEDYIARHFKFLPLK